MPEILHIDADSFNRDSFRLGRLVYETGFRPKHAVSIWRGGTAVGLGVDAYFKFQGQTINHTSIATSSYVGIGHQTDVVVKGLEHVVRSVCREDGLLIIDDVYESGRTIQKIVETLHAQARANAPRDIRVAAVHEKAERAVYRELPVLSLRRVPAPLWIDYPHELADLVEPDDPDDTLLKQKDPAIWEILHSPGFEPGDTHVEGDYWPRSARELLLDSLRLGVNIARSGYVPDFLIAIWPGGVSAGLPVHEVFRYFLKKAGKDLARPDHVAINTTRTHLSYRSRILGMQYLEERVSEHHDILIVDTTFRSGRMVSDVVTKLREALRRNLNVDRIKVACVYWNPDHQSTWTVQPFRKQPDYYIRKLDRDVLYPYSPQRLHNPRVELRESDPELHDILFS